MVVPKILHYAVELRAVRPKVDFSRPPVVYTNDLRSAEFQFEITDMSVTDLSTATATTLLYMRDGSFFQNPKEDVSLVGTTFSYTLKENEGNHAGIAKIQLIVTIGEAEYATQLYEFEIINGLETKVAQEVMIYDWTTLTRDARAYIDQFVADELLRDAEFDNNEFDRNTAFVASQDARTLAFGTEQTNRGTAFTAEQNERTAAFDESESGRTTAETGRVTAEEGRVEAETDRVTEEGKRVTAESGRVTEEGKRVTAESGRVTAESARATAETNRAAAFTAFNTRLTAEETATANNKVSAVKGKTFADVDSRFEDVETDTTMMGTNKVVNGEFAGLTGWSALYAALSAANNVLSITGDGTNATPRVYQITTGKITANTKIYATQLVKVTNAVCSNITVELKSDPSLSALGVFGSVTSPAQNVAYRVSGVVQAPSGYDNNNIVLFARNTYADGATASGKVLQLSVPIVLNLTEIFGVGNEPTAAQMDRLLTQFPNSWFDGTKNLFRASETLKKQIEIDARTEFDATNKVVNGEFSGLTGWSALYATLSAASNVLSIIGDGTNATPRAYQITTGKITANTKIYATQLVKVTNAVCSNITIELKSDPTLSALGVFGSLTSPAQNVAYRVSGIIQAPSGYDNNNIVLFARNTYADGATASGKVLQLSVPIVLNLTEIFGAGNEPTAAQMDRLLTQFPNSWFTGTENLFLAKWALNELRRLDNDKANKAQEAWITPTLVNGATGTFQYRKNEFGRLEFKGELTQASTASYFAITIAGYRPPAWTRCPITSIDGVVSMLTISDGGALYLHTPLAGKTISFSGISINIQ